MQTNTRNEIMEKLYKCNAYNELKTNKARIEYLLTNVIDFDQAKSVIKSTIDNTRQKNGKNLIMAKNCKIEADFYLQQVSLGNLDDRSKNLSRALKYYTRAILYMPILEDIKMAARLFARKCQVHLQLDENEAALYSIRIALDLFEKYGNNSIPSSIIFNYSILEVNCLKLLSRYVEAMESIDRMLNRMVESPESNNNNNDNDNSNTVSTEELLKMKKNIQQFGKNNNDINSKNQKNENEDKNDDDNGGGSKNDSDFFSYRLDERVMIQQSPVVGRHFVALTDIPERRIILEEKPYSIVIEQDYLHKKCSNCYHELSYKFFPCLYCTEVVFCDHTCFEQSYQQYHRHECGILSILKALTSASVHVFRMMSRLTPIIAYQTENNDELKDYSIDDYLKEINQRLVPEKDKTMDEKIRAYKMSSILWDHNSKHSTWANVHHIVFGVETAIILDIVHNMSLEKNKEFMFNFMDTIIVDIRRIIFNVFGWHEYYDDWTLRGHIANCQCLVGSLVNHSCVPNTNWEFKNGQIIFTTNRPIKKDEEITITYGPNKEMHYDRRQERLNHYFFACRCQACLTDARNGYALSCIHCNDGPVPFEVPLNNEPQLSGQCILCFKKYPDFQSNIDEYKKCLDHLRQISQIIPLHQDLILLDKAKEMARKLANLSIIPNPIVSRALLLFTNIVKICDKLLDYGEKLQLCLLVDSFLPGTFDDSAINQNDDDKLLENLNYWFESLADYIRFSERQPQNSSSLPNSVECKAWICLNNFKNRLDSILNGCKNMEKNFNITNGTGTGTGTGGKTIINTIIDSIFDKLNEQFKCLKIAAHNDDNDNDNDDDFQNNNVEMCMV
uniref:Uncharacterized protein LOC113795708 n=1 Tax=Dermatophagoides pteronyssinus TaxID=6956 RepID=A0A6P6Y9U4_DERPT|nr:uncharacterized protein LOC113795708 [Dermatophagoides pteronyssinus]